MHETQKMMQGNAVNINRSVGKTSKQDSQSMAQRNGVVLMGFWLQILFSLKCLHQRRLGKALEWFRLSSIMQKE